MVVKASKEYAENITRRMSMFGFHNPSMHGSIMDMMKPSVLVLMAADETMSNEDKEGYHKIAERIVDYIYGDLKDTDVKLLLPALELARLNILTALFDQFIKDSLGERNEGRKEDTKDT